MYKPAACEGCPHYPWAGFMQPDGSGKNGVLLVGEALGEEEAARGLPFVGRAGFMLNKLIKHAGLERDDFRIANAVWCRPPDNKLSGMPYERSAVHECGSRHLLPLIAASRPQVVVPMGAVALSSVLGGRKDILEARGYVWSSAVAPIIYPTVHPSFILRGNGEYGTVLIHDLQRAVELARDGWHPAPTRYLLDPPPDAAMRWADDYLDALAANPALRLAFDIETAWGDGKDEDKEDGESATDEEKSWIITRISFSYRPHEAISMPWRGDYRPAIARALGSAGAKVVWNEGFDAPRIRAAGTAILGPIYDGMVAWHVLQSDLRKKLAFVASMVLADQAPWKHLSASMPAFYNAADADIEGRCVDAIFARLHSAGLWDVYDRHIIQLAPLLARLSTRGMPIDAERRALYAGQLDARRRELIDALRHAIPDSARRIAHVYSKAKQPQQDDNLRFRPCTRQEPVCTTCGHGSPSKSHFRIYKRPTAKRPQNPCAGAGTRLQNMASVEWYRLAPWTPSNDQLTRYCQTVGQTCPTRRDGPHSKISFDADGCARQAIKYAKDPIWQMILDYRQIDKLAGTYVGRPDARTEVAL